ncbi:MAG: fibronectin type III domain-containing protein, partial [Saprospiraceae bacterium]|nr:fibronectin type III domain-containing protein [Saprospiraceae bacterium]
MWREDPSTSMVVGWDQLSGTAPVVFFDTKDHGNDLSKYRYKKNPDAVRVFHEMNNTFARFNNLLPNTVYFLIIKDSEGQSRRLSFRTAPNDPNTRLSIIAGGDSRN